MADAEHTYKFNVSMTCGGCSGAVDRVLKKLQGTPPHAPPARVTALARRGCPARERQQSFDCHRRTESGLTGTRGYTGVKNYEVSLENQSATVVAEPSLDYETVLRTIAKTGKKVNSGTADGVEKSVEVPAAA